MKRQIRERQRENKANTTPRSSVQREEDPDLEKRLEMSSFRGLKSLRGNRGAILLKAICQLRAKAVP